MIKHDRFLPFKKVLIRSFWSQIIAWKRIWNKNVFFWRKLSRFWSQFSCTKQYWYKKCLLLSQILNILQNSFREKVYFTDPCYLSLILLVFLGILVWNIYLKQKITEIWTKKTCNCQYLEGSITTFWHLGFFLTYYLFEIGVT